MNSEAASRLVVIIVVAPTLILGWLLGLWAFSKGVGKLKILGLIGCAAAAFFIFLTSVFFACLYVFREHHVSPISEAVATALIATTPSLIYIWWLDNYLQRRSNKKLSPNLNRQPLGRI